MSGFHAVYARSTLTPTTAACARAAAMSGPFCAAIRNASRSGTTRRWRLSTWARNLATLSAVLGSGAAGGGTACVKAGALVCAPAGPVVCVPTAPVVCAPAAPARKRIAISAATRGIVRCTYICLSICDLCGCLASGACADGGNPRGLLGEESCERRFQGREAELLHAGEDDRDDQQGERRRGDDAADDGDRHGRAEFAAGSVADGRRHHADRHRERSHQDRTEPPRTRERQRLV